MQPAALPQAPGGAVKTCGPSRPGPPASPGASAVVATGQPTGSMSVAPKPATRSTRATNTHSVEDRFPRRLQPDWQSALCRRPTASTARPNDYPLDCLVKQGQCNPYGNRQNRDRDGEHQAPPLEPEAFANDCGLDLAPVLGVLISRPKTTARLGPQARENTSRFDNLEQVILTGRKQR